MSRYDEPFGGGTQPSDIHTRRAENAKMLIGSCLTTPPAQQMTLTAKVYQLQDMVQDAINAANAIAHVLGGPRIEIASNQGNQVSSVDKVTSVTDNLALVTRQIHELNDVLQYTVKLVGA